MFDIDNLEILDYAILIPLGLLWGCFVLGILIGGLIVIKDILFPSPIRSWEQLIKDHEDMKTYNSLIDSNE